MLQDREPKGYPQYKPKDLGIDPVELWVFSVGSAVRSHFRAITLASAGLLALGYSVYHLQQGSWLPAPQEESVPKVDPKEPIVPFLTRPMLAQLSLDQLKSSKGVPFKRVMRSLGHEVGRMEDYTFTPRRGIVGKDGLLKRNYPSVGDTRVVFELGRWLGKGLIEAGEEVEWEGEWDVQSGDVTDRYGLLKPENPVIDEITFIRLGQKKGTADWEWFVKQLPAKSAYVRLPDGSIDFGQRAIGPTTDQIRLANRVREL